MKHSRGKEKGVKTIDQQAFTASMQSPGKSLFMKEGVLLAIVHVIKFLCKLKL